MNNVTNIDFKDVAKLLRTLRESEHLSQEEVAKKCGYKSRSSINKIELSRSLPLSKVELMARALETTPAELMGWTEESTDYIMETNPVEMPEDTQAQELYEKYKNAIPEIQNAIDNLLGVPKRDS